MAAILSRESILAVEDLPKQLVEVPEWGGAVYVRTLSGSERDAFEQSFVERRGKKQSVNLQNVRAKLVSMCVVGEDGNPLFTPADVELLGKKSGKALDRIFSVAQELSGLSEKDVDDLVGN